MVCVLRPTLAGDLLGLLHGTASKSGVTVYRSATVYGGAARKPRHPPSTVLDAFGEVAVLDTYGELKIETRKRLSICKLIALKPDVDIDRPAVGNVRMIS